MQETKQQGIGIVSLIAFSVMVIVGIVVYSSIDSVFATVTTSSDGAASAIGNVSQNTYGAFNLVSVGPIIFGAVIILGIVGMLYMRQ